MNNYWIILEVNILIIAISLLIMVLGAKLRFSHQRLLLIGAPFIAGFAVWVKTLIPSNSFALDIPVINLAPVLVGDELEISKSTSLVSLEFVYGIGLAIFIIVTAVRLIRTIFIFRGQPYERIDQYRIYRIPNRTSFSFFNRIQLSPELDERSAVIVLDHEKLHVQKQHSLDLIIMEVIHAIFWFNPMFFWVKNRLVNVHEYDVDEDLFGKYKVNYMHFLLNYAFGVKSTKFVLSNPFFNQLTLKQRIMMMKTKRQNSLRLWLILPVIIGTGFLVQCTEEQVEPMNEANDAEMSMENDLVEGEVLEMAEVMPVFEGGDEGMMQFIQENVKYPEVARENGETGTVYVGFIVDRTGVVKDVSIRKGVSDSIDAEAMRVVSMMPNWTPAENDGKPVAVQYTLPIAFRLD